MLGAGLHPIDDLGPPLGEHVDEVAWDAGHVRAAVDDGQPFDAEAAGELGAQLGLVEEPGGAGVVVDRPAIQCPPAAVRGAGGVGDQDVGVQGRSPAREVWWRNPAAMNPSPSTGVISRSMNRRVRHTVRSR